MIFANFVIFAVIIVTLISMTKHSAVGEQEAALISSLSLLPLVVVRDTFSLTMGTACVAIMFLLFQMSTKSFLLVSVVGAALALSAIDLIVFEVLGLVVIIGSLLVQLSSVPHISVVGAVCGIVMLAGIALLTRTPDYVRWSLVIAVLGFNYKNNAWKFNVFATYLMVTFFISR